MVIDPVRTSTATRADEFFQIRPGSDVALVLAMIHVLDRDGLIEAEWIEWLAHTYAGGVGRSLVKRWVVVMPIFLSGRATCGG